MDGGKTLCYVARYLTYSKVIMSYENTYMSLRDIIVVDKREYTLLSF